MMKITLRNELGVVKEAKVGFSWTTLFFGAFTPLFRGDFIWAGIQFVAALLSYGISNIVFAFLYNKIYIKKLLNKGYMPCTEQVANLLMQKGYISMDQQ